MRGFYIYETVTIPVKLSKPEAIEGYEKIVVSISQGSRASIDIIQVADSEEDNITIDQTQGIMYVHLGQRDTRKFQPGRAKLQVNIYYNNQKRDVSVQSEIEVYDNLYKKIIE